MQIVTAVFHLVLPPTQEAEDRYPAKNGKTHPPRTPYASMIWFRF
jgi:hypothetical protein